MGSSWRVAQALQVGNPLVEIATHGIGELAPIGLGRGAVVRQRSQRLANVLKTVPQSLSDPDEAHAAQRRPWKQTITAGAADRAEQAGVLVVSKRRHGDAAALGELADAEQSFRHEKSP